MSESKDIVITLSIGPVKGGERKVTISGAPAGEMPLVRVGPFQYLPDLIDAMWMELCKRKPQPIKREGKSPKAKGERPKLKAKSRTKGTKKATPARTSESPKSADQLVSPPAEDLPTIENDLAARAETQLSLVESEDEGPDEVEHEDEEDGDE